MHEFLHVAVLVFTLCGAAAVLLMLLWPLMTENPLPGPTRTTMLVLVALAALSLILEWTVVH